MPGHDSLSSVLSVVEIHKGEELFFFFFFLFFFSRSGDLVQNYGEL